MLKPELYAVLHYSQGGQMSVQEGTITISIPHVYGPFAARETANNWARRQHFLAYEVIEMEAP